MPSSYVAMHIKKRYMISLYVADMMEFHIKKHVKYNIVYFIFNTHIISFTSVSLGWLMVPLISEPLCQSRPSRRSGHAPFLKPTPPRLG